LLMHIQSSVYWSLCLWILAYRIWIPPELTTAMKNYTTRIGLTELARNLIVSEKNNIQPGEIWRKCKL
jgi:hypothetical protein